MKRSAEGGFTLIELLLYVSIVGSLLTAVIGFFATTVDARIKNQSISEVNQQGTALMEYITGTIRDASSITAPTAGTGAANALTLSVSGGTSTTIFNRDASNTVAQVSEGGGAAIPLTNSKVQITSLTFTNLSRGSTPGIVRVSFIVSRVNTGNRNEYDYQKTFTSSAALRWP